MQVDLPFESHGEKNPSPNRVPYAPDFTPALLGKQIGEHKVLGWLLRFVESEPTKTALLDEIVATGLAHINGHKNQRDMASHVVQGLRNYGLIYIDEDIGRLTQAGARVLAAPEEDRDRVFAAHILANCGGLRFVDEIRRFELRGEIPSMEDLAFLDRHPTAKSLSTMRAWLSRAGICPGKRYSVSPAALSDILGERTHLLFGLSEPETEFVFAARLLMAQMGSADLAGAHVATLAEQRSPGIRFRRKSLGQLLHSLEQRSLIEKTGTRKGAGGSKLTFRLCWQGIELGEEQLRPVLRQADLLLADLQPLAEILSTLEQGNSHEIGQAGEMLGVHTCLALGLRNLVWRKRAPHAEIDLLADRTAGLAYQRWAIQVKNTAGDLSSDRVAREIGAAAGSGVTHLLFLVPRAHLSRPARAEILHRCRLTHLHIFYLDEETFTSSNVIVGMPRALHLQAEDLSAIKRGEALARESSSR